MSAPISACWISKAVQGDQQAFKTLLGAAIYNLDNPSNLVFSCNCKPPCPEPSPEQIKALNAQIRAALLEHMKEHPL